MKFTVCDITFMFYVSVLYQLNIYVYIKLKEGEKCIFDVFCIHCQIYTLYARCECERTSISYFIQ